MNPPADCCDLCSLPLRYGSVHATFFHKPLRFCCTGCKQVYAMLLEATNSSDPADFKNTELFRRCRDMGIIPRTEADLGAVVQPVAAKDSLPTLPDKRAEEKLLSVNLTVAGMWCPACAWVIEEGLRKYPGIAEASCNFSTDRLRCTYNPVLVSPNTIVEMIEQLGYKADVPGSDMVVGERRREVVRLVVSAFLTANVMMLSFALYSGFFSVLPHDAVNKIAVPIALLAGVVLGYGGQAIFKRAWAGITSTRHSMETLIALGSASAYFFSVYNLFRGNIHLYFDTASMLVTLVLVGKFLESRAKGSILDDLQNFLALMPTKVRICSIDYPEGRYVSAEHLKEQDLFRIEESEIVPADAVILEGTAVVDESSITGEAVPVMKKAGDQVKSGTRITHGALKARARAVGKSSILGQMVEVTATALDKKTPLEGKTDRILQWFVPAIVLLALSTAAWCYTSGLPAEQSLIRAITVIVISCPCALGVAIPLARVAGISSAGRSGIVVRDFSSFELAEAINAFVFDKTGTITTGKWRLRKIRTFDNYSEQEVLALAAGLEQDSDHAIARAIRQRAQATNIKPRTLSAIMRYENGVAGVHNGDMVKIGSRTFAGSEQSNHDESTDGASLVYLSVNGMACAVLEFGDTLREGARSGVKGLASMGYELSLVSGDSATAAKVVANSVGIKDAHGGLLPHEKAEFIAGRQGQGHRVAMVGDGLNDAPALVQADLAVAVHGETPLANEVADVTLMRGNPTQVLDFLHLAKSVNRKVLQNLMFSFVYNVVSIPIAMSGLLNPLIAVGAMIMSSLSVTGNTLLLSKKSG